ncbi:MAG TPA: ATP-binding protein [Gemmatimonadaceae bacterium]|nr:ATP-binding protein [Gemmatimonadaceae bacterium]
MSEAPTSVPPRQRLTKPISRTLTAIAEIAAALATGDSVGAVVPGVLAAVASELDGAQATLWLRGLDGLRRAWVVANDTTLAAAVEDKLRVNDGTWADGFVAARLVAGRQELGALSARPGRTLLVEDQVFLSAVADLLAPALRDAEYAHRLESEVAARTREIEEQRRFTEKIIDSLPVGLYVIDRAYRIQAWNRKRETGLQGVSREEAIGRTIFEILHRQPAELLRSEFESVFETGEMQQFPIESTAFGESRTYRITKIPMHLEDKDVSHIITIGEDITEWRQAEERFAQTEKLAAIGTLAAGVMHEINNPLATIGACAETLTLGLDEHTMDPVTDIAEFKDSLALIQHEVYRCKGIIDGLLDFSRPKSTHKFHVDLNAVIEKTLRLVKHHPRFRRVNVSVEPGDGLRAVLANEEQMVQVFMALLLNALDAMEDKGLITLRTRMDEKDETTIAEVIDRGHGIRSADRTKIFEPFYTTKPPSRGTGLGLSICYAIVTEHGGRIEVDSVVGEGSVFRILLPSATT